MVEQGRADRAGWRSAAAAPAAIRRRGVDGSDVFGAGASYYGIGDLETLAGDSQIRVALPRLTDRTLPERTDLYVERSPVHHLDRLSSPMILFQGTEDKAVPPNQATDMADALRAKGCPSR